MAACAAPAPPSAPVLAIVGVAVVDVEGGRVSADRTVVVREDRVVAVGPSGSVPIPPSATVIDGAGGYLLPGLWDMHVHALFDADLAERM
ncbi:MAG: hypothetical protein GWN02_19180, partial [Gemmatimonadetes bacterium]|nr:hypothetical protein [Gemmatimonadota bacterium]